MTGILVQAILICILISSKVVAALDTQYFSSNPKEKNLYL